MRPLRHTTPHRLCAAFLVVSSFCFALSQPLASAQQLMTDEVAGDTASVAASALPDRQAAEFSSARWDLVTTAAGTPTVFSTEVTATADIDELVVDVYLDGVLIDSQIDPDSIVVDLRNQDVDPISGTAISLVGREGAAEQCERIDGTVSFRNTSVLRSPHVPTTVAEALSVSVSGDDPIAVANIAAAAEREMVIPGATIDLDAAVELAVSTSGGDILVADVAGLSEQRSFAASTIAAPVDATLRTVQRSSVELGRTGGSAFISATGFSGRVGDVQFAGEINLTPLADGGGFAIEVNDRVVTSGEIDQNGQASFATTVNDWPRDAQVNVRLVLPEDRTPCSNPVSGFAGTANIELLPLATDFDDPNVRDFPQALLEATTVALWVDDDVPSQWVAVAAAAIQDTSVEPLRFSAAADPAAATLHLTSGTGAVSAVSGTLTLPLNEQVVTELSTDRFWNFGLEAEVVQTNIATQTDSVSVATEGLSTPRAGWIVIVAVAVAAVAVLLLFRRNSQEAP